MYHSFYSSIEQTDSYLQINSPYFDYLIRMYSYKRLDVVHNLDKPLDLSYLLQIYSINSPHLYLLATYWFCFKNYEI